MSEQRFVVLDIMWQRLEPYLRLGMNYHES